MDGVSQDESHRPGTKLPRTGLLEGRVAINEDRMDRDQGSAHDRLALNGFTRQIRQSRGVSGSFVGSKWNL